MLNNTARQIIAQVKPKEQEKVQESILSNVADSIVDTNLERKNLTIVEKEEDDYTSLQANLILYKEFVNEMRDRNSLLQELLNKTKTEFKQIKEKKTYRTDNICWY